MTQREAQAAKHSLSPSIRRNDAILMKGLKCYHDMLSMIHFKKYQDLITNNMLPCCRTIQIYTHCNAPAISQAATHLSALRQAVFPYITFYDVIQPPPPQPREPSELPPPPPPSTTRSRRAQSPLHARAHTHTHRSPTA